MLEITEIPVSADKHPNPPSPCLLKHEFTLALIAPKGSGKTTLLINMLKFYKGYFHKIIIFSPTIKNDEKWQYAKNLNLLAENKELKKILLNVKKKKRKDNVVPYDPPRFLFDKPTEPAQPPKKFTGKIDPEFFISEYSPEDLEDILDQQQEMVEFLESEGYSKHKADRILLILDDLVGSSLYSNAKRDPFKRLNANHRHSSISVMMVTQAYKEIPKPIRTQFSGLIIFKIHNEMERKVIYEEFPMGFTKNEWYDIYKECTDKKHGFMFIDCKKDPGDQIMASFSYIVGNKFKKSMD